MKAGKEKKLTRNEIRHQISSTLKSSLEGLKEKMGERKLHRSIKKASKILAAGIKVEKNKKSGSKIQPMAA